MYYQRRKRINLTPEQKAARAIEIQKEKELKAAQSMTCQICGRPIYAETGLIAHHGYERPFGEGWQSASCNGARALPFEVSRDTLGCEIENLKVAAISAVEYIAKLNAETVELKHSYKLSIWDRNNSYITGITRANFEEKKAEAPKAFNSSITYDSLKTTTIQARTYILSQIESSIIHQTERYKVWVQTHKRENDQWIKI